MLNCKKSIILGSETFSFRPLNKNKQTNKSNVWFEAQGLYVAWLCYVQNCDVAFDLWFSDLFFELVWHNFECVIRREVTLCG